MGHRAGVEPADSFPVLWGYGATAPPGDFSTSSTQHSSEHTTFGQNSGSRSPQFQHSIISVLPYPHAAEIQQPG
jgi:hypothetical protein